MKIIKKKIYSQIEKSLVLLYMKGSPNFPLCGFSKQACDIISIYVKNFNYVDVLINQDIRITLPKISNWPTFPQLWVNKKFIGGCDIILKLHKSNLLKNIFYKVLK